MGGLFSVLEGKAIYTPRYLVAKCIPIEGSNMKIQDVSSFNNNPVWYECTSGNSLTHSYIPPIPEFQCEYNVRDFDLITVYDCPLTATSKDDTNCNKQLGYVSSFFNNGKTFYASSGRKIYIDADRLISFASPSKLQIRYPSYGLDVTQASGFSEQTTGNCYYNSLPSDLHSVGKTGIEVFPNKPANFVTELSPAMSTQYVSLKEVNSGNPIYISRVGYYYNVKKADDGFTYVDTASGEISAPSIQCIPRTANCNDEAKITTEPATCNIYGGAITGYAAIQNDNTQECLYKCENGKQVPDLTSCRKLLTQGCPSGSTYNPSKNDCSGGVNPPPTNNFNGLLLISALIVGLVVSIFTYKVMSKNFKQKAFIIIASIVFGILFAILFTYIVQQILTVIKFTLWVLLGALIIALLMGYGLLKAYILK